MIRCGWCGHPTEPERCGHCGHRDPEQPWIQRGEEVPKVAVENGRPALDPADIARRLAEARAAIGSPATVARIAEYLDVSERTVRRWQQM